MHMGSSEERHIQSIPINLSLSRFVISGMYRREPDGTSMKKT